MTNPSPDEALAALARAYRVTVEYWDWQGRQVQVAPHTVRQVLAALGVDASSDAAVGAALRDVELAEWRRMVPATTVVRQGQPAELAVHVPHGDPVAAWVVLEDGSERHDVAAVDRWVDPREVDGRLVGRATVRLPADLPLGWHQVRARSGPVSASGALVVVPDRLEVAGVSPRSRMWGLQTQLYQVCSTQSWGSGDLTDLGSLAAWSAGLGADFVLVNPLHAAEPLPPMTASPYLPSSRRWRNPLYLRVEDVPEYAGLSPAAGASVLALAEPLRRVVREDRLLDRDQVWAAKRSALELVRQVPRSAEREAQLARFRAAGGSGLRTFATWCALAETYGSDWTSWPEELRHPDRPEVAAAAEALSDLVELHVWLQWLLDEQLGRAQQACRTTGMELGLVLDLPVGVHPRGADAWALQDVLVGQVSVGAPADQFNQLGQDWSQPPLHPARLAETGYAPYREVVRASLAHAGGLRVDHVVGLFRQWWVPSGSEAADGTYVGYDHEALVGILLLEAQRAGALVVGEDLGVVEPWVREYLAQRGVLGTSVVWFEKGWSEEPLAPQHWREACLATVTTHDLPPSAGYLRGEHLTIREGLGLLSRPVEQERLAADADRSAMVAALQDQGLLGPDPEVDDVVLALHALLTRTPCRLVGVALADLVGDRRAVNQPGTDQEYPNWRLPLADAAGRVVLLEDVRDGAPLAERLAGVLAATQAQ